MPGRTPGRLLAYYRRWAANPEGLRAAPSTLAFAVLGQARAAGLLTPEKENRLLGNLITYWALRSTLDVNAAMATLPVPGGAAAWLRPAAAQGRAVPQGRPVPLRRAGPVIPASPHRARAPVRPIRPRALRTRAKTPA
jgi:hypothetical protein